MNEVQSDFISAKKENVITVMFIKDQKDPAISRKKGLTFQLVHGMN
jgi:hypothetical protein